jgi:hypothetical protein
VKVRDVHLLTALPDERNGGLLLDSGLLRLRDEQAANQIWQMGDEFVVERRALTVALMDEVAEAVGMPLVKVQACTLSPHGLSPHGVSPRT